MVENIKQQEIPEQSPNKIREKRFTDDLKNKNALEKTDAPKAMEKSKNMLDKELVLQGCNNILQVLDETNKSLKNFMKRNENADDWKGVAIQNWLKDYITSFNNYKESFNKQIIRLQKLLPTMPELSKTIQSLRSTYYGKLQEYQWLLMGVGGPQDKTTSDAYESISYAGNTAKWEIQKNIIDMMKNLTVSSSLNYLRQLHSKMNNNEMQSDTVRNYYKEHITTMHQALIQRIQSLPAWEEKNKSLYELVNIISGHDEKVDKGLNPLKDSVVIDTAMSKALLQQFLWESEVLKKINASQSTPVFEKNYMIGWVNYTPENLNTSIIKKLEQGSVFPIDMITGLEFNDKNILVKDLPPAQQIVIKSFIESTIEINRSSDSQRNTLEWKQKNYRHHLNKNFEERSEKSLDKDVTKIPTLTENDRKIVNLYKNIQGVWAQISDETLKSAKEYGVMWVWVTAFVAGSALTGGILGAAIGWYVGSAWADIAAGKWYRSNEEIKWAALNYTINAWVAMASTGLANKLWHRDKIVKVENNASSLSKEAIKQNIISTTAEWKWQGKTAEVVGKIL